MRKRLERALDPVEIEKRRARGIPLTREHLLGTAKELDIPHDRLDGLAALVVDQQRRREVTRLRCQLSPGCEVKAEVATLNETERNELAGLLGAEKAGDYLSFVNLSSERAQVQIFQQRLPRQDELNRGQITQLAQAMSDEGEALEKAAGERGTQVLNLFPLRAEIHRDTAIRKQMIVRTATEYSERLQRRAAAFLTAAQLAALAEMHGVALERLKNEETTYRFRQSVPETD